MTIHDLMHCDPEAEADSAASALAESLAYAGLPLLPSLRGVVAFGGRPHVELGGASASAVMAIAEWMRERV